MALKAVWKDDRVAWDRKRTVTGVGRGETGWRLDCSLRLAVVEWLGQKPGQKDERMSQVHKADVDCPWQKFTHEGAEK